MKPRIVLIVTAIEHANDGEWVILYGLAEDGTVWRAEPNVYAAPEWEGPVVRPSTPSTGAKP